MGVFRSVSGGVDNKRYLAGPIWKLSSLFQRYQPPHSNAPRGVCGTGPFRTLFTSKCEVKLMPTAKEYRQQAQECVELAKTAKDLYAKQAMMELAEEFSQAADALERKSAA